MKILEIQDGGWAPFKKIGFMAITQQPIVRFQ